MYFYYIPCWIMFKSMLLYFLEVPFYILIDLTVQNNVISFNCLGLKYGEILGFYSVPVFAYSIQISMNRFFKVSINSSAVTDLLLFWYRNQYSRLLTLSFPLPCYGIHHICQLTIFSCFCHCFTLFICQWDNPNEFIVNINDMG